MKFTLRQLQVFVASAHHENLTRAAQSLNLSQSAASSALKELEQQFSIQLFDRVGKRLQLNELGRRLRPRAEALLAQAEELEQELACHDQPGDLRVGATLTIGNYLAVPIMARYLEQNPGSQVHLEVANTARIAQMVLNFDLDLGLIEGELHHPDLQVSPWQADELVVFCHPQHPLAQQPQPLSDAQLLEQRWILRESGSGTRQTFDRALHDLLPRLQIALQLQHTEAIKRAVEAGLGIGCLSRVTLQEAFRRGSLVPLPLPAQRDLQRRFYFILRRDKYRTAGVECWLNLCQSS